MLSVLQGSTQVQPPPGVWRAQRMSQPIKQGEVRNSEYVHLYIQFLEGG